MVIYQENVAILLLGRLTMPSLVLTVPWAQSRPCTVLALPVFDPDLPGRLLSSPPLQGCWRWSQKLAVLCTAQSGRQSAGSAPCTPLGFTAAAAAAPPLPPEPQTPPRPPSEQVPSHLQEPSDDSTAGTLLHSSPSNLNFLSLSAPVWCKRAHR